MSSKTYLQAVAFDNDSSEPLLVVGADDEERKQRQDDSVPRCQNRMPFLVFGVFLGIFTQFSTLGMNSVLVRIFGDEHLTAEAGRDALIFSILWSFLASTIAVVALESLRSFAITASQVSSEQEEQDAIVDPIDCFFMVGFMVGVCSLWGLTEIYFGVQSHVLYFLTSLFITLFMLRGFKRCFCSKKERRQTTAVDSSTQVDELLIV